jgi:hypothetical protein
LLSSIPFVPWANINIRHSDEGLVDRKLEAISFVALIIVLVGTLAVTAMVPNFREMVDPDLSFEVIGSGTADPSSGPRTISGHYSALVTLNVTSANTRESFVLEIPRFFARTAGGSSLWCLGMYPEKEPMIEAGGFLTVAIHFQVPLGDTITSLVYHMPSGVRIEVMLP